MTECVILFRNPSNGTVGVMKPDANEDGSLAFPNRETAIEVCQTHPLLQAWPHQLVELDEL